MSLQFLSVTPRQDTRERLICPVGIWVPYCGPSCLRGLPPDFYGVSLTTFDLRDGHGACASLLVIQGTFTLPLDRLRTQTVPVIFGLSPAPFHPGIGLLGMSQATQTLRTRETSGDQKENSIITVCPPRFPPTPRVNDTRSSGVPLGWRRTPRNDKKK